MQPSRLRLFLQFLCFEILVILAAIFAFMTTRVLAQAIKQRFHMRDIRPQLAVEEPAMEPVPLPEILGQTISSERCGTAPGFNYRQYVSIFCPFLLGHAGAINKCRRTSAGSQASPTTARL